MILIGRLSMALAPLDGGEPAAAASDHGGMVLRYSILNGALELLPETLATMPILPLQMKMVWRIGKARGFELDRFQFFEAVIRPHAPRFLRDLVQFLPLRGNDVRDHEFVL